MTSDTTPRRYISTLTVSMFAHDQEDAEHLASLLRGEIDIRLLGGGQSIVQVVETREDTFSFGPQLVTVIHRWDPQNGQCYDCGAPAAYTSDEHSTSPENLRCSVCAATDAAGGAVITYLFELGG
jgi:hypothetical protein